MNPKIRHFTTRRSFVILVGLSVLALYVMWAAYGAAPTNLRFLAESQGESMGGMEMGGHGSKAGAMTPEEFHEITLKFVEEFSLPDGSVRPTRRRKASMTAMGDGHEGREDVAGEQGQGQMAKEEDHVVAMKPGETAPMASSAGMTARIANEQEEGHGPDEGGEPIDVYLMAMRFSYTPTVLRLERGVPYRFRMMSMDVNHGASIHTGFAGHIMRRPAQIMAEMVMTFTEPGEFMMYCTVYCGEGHSQMKGKIIIE
ncbi:MAG: hypothetical protein ACE5FM_09415 [Methyloligellaceae bacterium]